MPVVRARLQVVTDGVLAGARGIVPAVQAAIAGGADLIQYREKNMSRRAKLAEVQALLAVCRDAGVPLIVNDDLDLALAAGADGAHVGQDDLPVPVARRLLGQARIIGCSAATLAEARQAVADGADYLGVGPVFSTATKSDCGEPRGLALVRDVAAAVTLPWFVIGGINAGTLAEVMAAGARRIAVVSAVMAAPDPRAAAADLRARLLAVS